jgi:hypothetical protein
MNALIFPYQYYGLFEPQFILLLLNHVSRRIHYPMSNTQYLLIDNFN